MGLSRICLLSLENKNITYFSLYLHCLFILRACFYYLCSCLLKLYYPFCLGWSFASEHPYEAELECRLESKLAWQQWQQERSKELDVWTAATGTPARSTAVVDDPSFLSLCSITFFYSLVVLFGSTSMHSKYKLQHTIHLSSSSIPNLYY